MRGWQVAASAPRGAGGRLCGSDQQALESHGLARGPAGGGR